MKYGKFKVNHKKTGGRIEHIYPLNYEARVVGNITWDGVALSEGDNLCEFVATVADDFPFATRMVEIDRTTLDAFIDTAAALQVATPDFTQAEMEQQMKDNHKAIVDDHEVIAINCLQMNAKHNHYWTPDHEAATMDLSVLE